MPCSAVVENSQKITSVDYQKKKMSAVHFGLFLYEFWTPIVVEVNSARVFEFELSEQKTWNEDAPSGLGSRVRGT